MKHLFILLFTAACFSQNAKVIAYRLVNTVDDGPCSIASYVNWAEGGFLSYVTAESNDQELIRNLIAIKMQAKKWKKSDCGCNGGYGLQWGSIPNMFVIESKEGNDTLFTNHNNTQIIFPKYQTGHKDKDSILVKALTGNIKDFFEHDFDEQIRSQFYPKENDSIIADKILYNGKHATCTFNENFDEHPGNFNKIKEDSLYDYVEKLYTYKNDTVRLYRGGIRITITDPESDWDVGGLKVNDTEEKFRIRYPKSAKVQKYYDIRYEDILRRYFYSVELTNNKGNITYFIKDKVIEKIEIYLN